MTATTHTPHCESCGRTDAESLAGDQGYTSCCNEPVCYGGRAIERFAFGPFGTMDVKGDVAACCGAQADKVIPAPYDRLFRL